MSQMSDETKLLKILLLFAGLMLCVAILPMIPSPFHIFLRLVVCGTALYVGIALRSHETLNSHFIPLMLLAALFNPLIFIDLGTWIWLPIDLGTAVYFLTLSKKI
jgi:hypothetical protein